MSNALAAALSPVVTDPLAGSLADPLADPLSAPLVGQGHDPIQAAHSVETPEYPETEGDDVYADPHNIDDSINGGAGNDIYFGADGNNTLIGGDGNDQLFGGNDDDSLVGGADNDQLFGGAGDNTINGGAGRDFAGIQGARADFTLEQRDDGAIVVTNTVTGDVNILIGIEELAFDDAWVPLAPGVTGTWHFGGIFDDTITGTDGDDGLYGDTGDDLLSAGAGNDYLDGGLGSDTLDGGDGNDFVGMQVSLNDVTLATRVVDGVNTLDITHTVTGDVDTVMNVEGLGFVDGYMPLAAGVVGTWHYGSLFDEIITGTDAADGLFGDGGDDTVSGGGGADYFHGLADDGSDLLDGGTGNDFLGIQAAQAGYTIVRDESGDVLVTETATGAIDTLRDLEAIGFNDGSIVVVAVQQWGDWFEGGIFGDVITGRAVTDGMGGGTGNDTLDAGGGDDYLRGDAGDDRMIGGTGNDFLSGGAGADTFVFDSASGFDFVEDFEVGVDRIELAPGTSYFAEAVGGGTWISFGSDAAVLLLGVDFADFDDDWITFGTPTIDTDVIINDRGVQGTYVGDGTGTISFMHEVPYHLASPWTISGTNLFEAQALQAVEGETGVPITFSDFAVIETGSHADVYTSGYAPTVLTDIHLGGGDDTFSWLTFAGDSLNIFAEGGYDTVRIGGTIGAGHTGLIDGTVNGGEANDTLAIQHTLGRNGADGFHVAFTGDTDGFVAYGTGDQEISGSTRTVFEEFETFTFGNFNGDNANHDLVDMRASGGNLTVNTGHGDDTLLMGAGGDVLTGGRGADTFVIDRWFASDTITDFTVGEDILVFEPAGLDVVIQSVQNGNTTLDILGDAGRYGWLTLEGHELTAEQASDLFLIG